MLNSLDKKCLLHLILSSVQHCCIKVASIPARKTRLQIQRCCYTLPHVLCPIKHYSFTNYTGDLITAERSAGHLAYQSKKVSLTARCSLLVTKASLQGYSSTVHIALARALLCYFSWPWFATLLFHSGSFQTHLRSSSISALCSRAT